MVEVSNLERYMEVKLEKLNHFKDVMFANVVEGLKPTT